jgi:hypothetical protein
VHATASAMARRARPGWSEMLIAGSIVANGSERPAP